MTHKSLESNFSDKKSNLLQEMIKNIDKNMESNLNYVKNFFFAANPIPNLPHIKREKISYLNTKKDYSKSKDQIIQKIIKKRDVFRQMISGINKNLN